MIKLVFQARVIGFTFLLAVISLLFWVDVGSGSAETPARPSPVVITGAENHDIDLVDAARLTKNYRVTASDDALKAELFGRDAILDILSQPECVGLRIYVGRKEDGREVFVLVGVNSTGSDITDGKVAETGWPCPPTCDGTSALASDMKLSF